MSAATPVTAAAAVAPATRQRFFGTDGIRGRFGEPPLDRRTIESLGRQLGRWLAEKKGPAAAGRDGGAGAAGAAGAGAAGGEEGAAAATPCVILGGDTRESTPDLCAWLAAGLTGAGVRVRQAGVIPTPGVSHLVASLGADAGIAVSASHNPYPDNGVKLLDAQGGKWTDADEQEIEQRLLADLADHADATGAATGSGSGGVAGPGAAAAGGAFDSSWGVGDGDETQVALRLPGNWPELIRHGGVAAAAGAPLTIEPGLHQIYLDHLARSVAPGDRRVDRDLRDGGGGGGDAGSRRRPLDGLRIVIDAGNGAAAAYASELFERLGAEVVARLGAAPDGRNVNLNCGSTAPERMAAETAVRRGHLGVAFDGDADRCILADERGDVRDGDAILYLWAIRLHAQGRLQPPAIVATSMSNLGLERALARQGIAVVRCGVGDRAVVDAMERDGILLGGEQSGHIVHRDLAATGDGLLTAVQVAALVREAGQPLSTLLEGFRRYPQILLNVPVARKPAFATIPAIADAAQDVEAALGKDGRLVLRYSGTEPLARVMIEGPDQATIETLAEGLASVIASEIGSATSAL